MTGFFDTNTFLWWDGDKAKLSTPVHDFCTDPTNTLVVSVVSLWEIQIKVQIGKLSLRKSLPDIVAEQTGNDVRILSVLPAHIYALDALPFLHKAPFDRLLIA